MAKKSAIAELFADKSFKWFEVYAESTKGSRFLGTVFVEHVQDAKAASEIHRIRKGEKRKLVRMLHPPSFA